MVQADPAAQQDQSAGLAEAHGAKAGQRLAAKRRAAAPVPLVFAERWPWQPTAAAAQAGLGRTG